MTITLRLFDPADWPELWAILEPVFRAGETYTFPRDISERRARELWIDIPKQTIVACSDDGTLLGTYYIKANQMGPGEHVANCGYVVSSAARGQGLAYRMGLHSLDLARDLGFKALQFNAVVSTNTAAIHVWKKCGMAVIGRLPKAFDHPQHGLVDALIMYQWLGDQ